MTSPMNPHMRNSHPLKANDENWNDYGRGNNAHETLESGNERKNQHEKRTWEKTVCGKRFTVIHQNKKPGQSPTASEISQ